MGFYFAGESSQITSSVREVKAQEIFIKRDYNSWWWMPFDIWKMSLAFFTSKTIIATMANMGLL